MEWLNRRRDDSEEEDSEEAAERERQELEDKLREDAKNQYKAMVKGDKAKEETKGNDSDSHEEQDDETPQVFFKSSEIQRINEM